MSASEPPGGAPPPEDRPPLEPLRQVDHGRVLVDRAVLEQVRAHVGSDATVEHGGILVGHVDATSGITIIIDAIRGVGTLTRSASLTFTHETWDHVNDVMAQKYPDAKMVGWYHSHPGFGIFLSDYDQFIHRNFFLERWQVAYVDDPVLDKWGFFGWDGEELVRFGRWGTWNSDAGDGPMIAAAPAPPAAPAAAEFPTPQGGPPAGPVITVEPEPEPGEGGVPGWVLGLGIAILSAIAVFALVTFLFGGDDSGEADEEAAPTEASTPAADTTMPPAATTDTTTPATTLPVETDVPSVMVLNGSVNPETNCAATGAVERLAQELDPVEVQFADADDDQPSSEVVYENVDFEQWANDIANGLGFEADAVVQAPTEVRDARFDVVVIIGDDDAGEFSSLVDC